MDRNNRNRVFKKIRVWQDAVVLYIPACEIPCGFPFELKKTAANAIDAAHSVSRNISEGYCRGSRREYLNSLNYARASCGEFQCCYESFLRAGQISQTDYERLDELHFKVEKRLLALIDSLLDKGWLGEWVAAKSAHPSTQSPIHLDPSPRFH